MVDARDESICRQLEEPIEAYVDGDLETSECSRLAAHLEGCPFCREQLALAIELRDGLRALPRLEAPRAAIASVLETARAEARRQAARRQWGWLEALRLRPAVAGLAAAALVMAIALALFPARPSGPEPSAEDPAVARATLEAKLALAHFARTNRKIGLELGDDVVRERVVGSATRGFVRTLASDGRLESTRTGATVNERG